MTTKSNQEGTTSLNSRRNFLYTAAAVGGSAVVISGTAETDTNDETVKVVEQTAQNKGYQDTAHVRAYYKTASI